MVALEEEDQEACREFDGDGGNVGKVKDSRWMGVGRLCCGGERGHKGL